MTATELINAFEESDMDIFDVSRETSIPPERVRRTMNGNFDPMSVEMEQYNEVFDL